jgi:hypothetical protein
LTLPVFSGIIKTVKRDRGKIKKVVFRRIRKKELKKYRPNCYYNPYGKFYHVTEYFIDCYEADEDGEFLSGCDYISAYEYKFDNEIDDIVFTEEKGE